MQELHGSTTGKSGNWRLRTPSYSITDQLGQVPKKVCTMLETRYLKIMNCLCSVQSAVGIPHLSSSGNLPAE